MDKFLSTLAGRLVLSKIQKNSPWLQYYIYRRKQDGVYASYTFGPVGRQVKVSKVNAFN
jgi:hypothetical protein